MAVIQPLPYYFEGIVASDRDYADPTRDVQVRVEVTSPSDQSQEIDAFWDGGRIWRFRFSAFESGEWIYRTICSDTSSAMHERRGRFEFRPYAGSNPVYRHGPLRVAEDRFHFEHADGTPFFWLADTAWNGMFQSRRQDWEHYPATRREQGFTAVQAMLTQFHGMLADPESEQAYSTTDDGSIRVNPSFFRRLDPKVEAIIRHGLVPVLTLVWKLSGDPLNYISEENSVYLAKDLVSRYSAYHSVYFLGGDGDYEGEHSERWIRTGRAVFEGSANNALVTMHPRGRSWVGEEFRREDWFDFVGYQSGHRHREDILPWITSGPPAQNWANEPHCPVVDIEPCYEDHNERPSGRRRFTPKDVRQAMYYSLLVIPTAGVTYGHHGIWPWIEARREPEGHWGTGVAPLWHEGLVSEGSVSMTCLMAFFNAVDWWKLRPAPDILTEQPGGDDARHFIAAAKAEDDTFVVAYLPDGGQVSLRSEVLAGLDSARWYNPRTGIWLNAGEENRDNVTFAAPDQDDWLLWIGTQLKNA